MTSENRICCWDFSLSSTDTLSYIDIIKWCKDNCKKWCFQLEEGASGYRHFQGRINLKVKSRSLIGQLHEKTHWSITSKESSKDFYYVDKCESRIEGPWRDTISENLDNEDYIPRQVREITKLKNWQQQIINNASVWDTRFINIVVCYKGNIGKSTLCNYADSYNIGIWLPGIFNSAEDLINAVYGMKKSKLYLIDLPRAMKKQKLSQLFIAIELLKDGYIFDKRYSFKRIKIDCPNIWLFTNKTPNLKYLSSDRWNIWTINDNEELEILDNKLSFDSYITDEDSD